MSKCLCRKVLSFVLLLTLLLPAGMTTRAAPAALQSAFDCANVTEIPRSECEALVALYDSTDGDNWSIKTDWLATNTPCSWDRVTCEDGNVTRIHLWSNQLNGQIPSEIGQFNALTYLHLGANELSGTIPAEIGNLKALEWLSLHSNQLSGAIPAGIGELIALNSLLLHRNQLSDSIPVEIGNLTALTELYLDDNQLSGSIPTEIGALGALKRLSLFDNQLSGSIPAEVGNLTALEILSLDDNQLSGSIPPEIGNLTALTELQLGRNQLSGSIPPEIGNLAALTYLSLGNNQLSGPIPSTIGNLFTLTQLWLSNNQLSGPIPPELGDLTALRSLYLWQNQLTGSIPPEIGQLTALQVLYLNNNLLSGAVPPEIGNLTALIGLYLGDNQLTDLPLQVGHLTALRVLSLGNNQLSGPLPSEIGNLIALTSLGLHNNPLSGELPAALTPLTLEHFTFYDTDWCVPAEGDVPAWLSTIPKLYGTGLICVQDLGSLSGAVTLTDTTPISDVQVNLYRSLSPAQYRYLTTTHTTADGTYQFTDLGQGLGIDYRVQFVDPTHQLAPQYYDAKPTIATADVITITPGVPRTGIDAILDLPQPPAAGVETESGSVAYNPDGTAQITMPAPNPSDITITRAVTCAVGTPDPVTLTLSTGPHYTMTNVSGDLYRATIPAADLTGNATLSIAATCGVTTTETTVGYITLYDPSGYITDAQTGEPVVGATVTLYNVPGWLPKTSPDDDSPNTCQSHASKAEDAPWDQPAPTHLGIVSNADVTLTDPKLPYQYTTAEGYYGWDVSEGCWYVTIKAEGYEPLTSPVVGVPPEVTDLNLALTPLTSDCIPLTDVGIDGPLDTAGSLYIDTLYTFQAVITPTNATTPTTYTWDPEPDTGKGTPGVTYQWSTPNTYTITLTAENCGGPVITTRSFQIRERDDYDHFIYLPLVLRNSP